MQHPEYLPIPTPRKRLGVSPFLNFSAMNLSKGRTADGCPLVAWSTRSALKNVPPCATPHEREPGTDFNDEELQLAGSD